MYDIYFDEGDMHQVVEDEMEVREFWLVGQSFSFSAATIDMYPEEEVTQDYTPPVFERPKEGLHCTKCHELFPHAEANQPNGTLICYSCRNFG